MNYISQIESEINSNIINYLTTPSDVVTRSKFLIFLHNQRVDSTELLEIVSNVLKEIKRFSQKATSNHIALNSGGKRRQHRNSCIASTEIKAVVLVVVQTKVFSGSARPHRAQIIDAEKFSIFRKLNTKGNVNFVTTTNPIVLLVSEYVRWYHPPLNSVTTVSRAFNGIKNHHRRKKKLTSAALSNLL